MAGLGMSTPGPHHRRPHRIALQGELPPPLRAHLYLYTRLLPPDPVKPRGSRPQLSGEGVLATRAAGSRTLPQLGKNRVWVLQFRLEAGREAFLLPRWSGQASFWHLLAFLTSTGVDKLVSLLGLSTVVSWHLRLIASDCNLPHPNATDRYRSHLTATDRNRPHPTTPDNKRPHPNTFVCA